MASNELSFNQVATILNDIQLMVTGRGEPVTMGDFSTVADTVLKAGYEKVYNAIGTILGRTIYSVRPYSRKYKGLERTDGEFKLHTRKLQIEDTDFEDNDTTKWPVHYDAEQNPADGNGQSVDQQIIKKSKILQTNFYGMNTYQNHYTLFDEQLEVAFSSPAELGRFIQMITMNVSNMFEQAREDFARMNLVNYIAALVTLHNPVNGTVRVVNLLSEYNDETGLSLTTQTVKKPENYAHFVRWALAYIKTVSDMFTERTVLYQNNISGHSIIRHTPVDSQRLFIFAPDKNNIEANVLSTTFHEDYLRRTYTETVNFWQNPINPDTINFAPTFTDPATGSPTSAQAVEQAGVFAVLMDMDALGYSVVKTTMKAAPYNARADYQNYFMKDYHKNFMDVTEKGVVFIVANSGSNGGGGNSGSNGGSGST